MHMCSCLESHVQAELLRAVDAADQQDLAVVHRDLALRSLQLLARILVPAVWAVLEAVACLRPVAPGRQPWLLRWRGGGLPLGRSLRPAARGPRGGWLGPSWGVPPLSAAHACCLSRCSCWWQPPVLAPASVSMPSTFQARQCLSPW